MSSIALANRSCDLSASSWATPSTKIPKASLICSAAASHTASVSSSRSLCDFAIVQHPLIRFISDKPDPVHAFEVIVQHELAAVVFIDRSLYAVRKQFVTNGAALHHWS